CAGAGGQSHKINQDPSLSFRTSFGFLIFDFRLRGEEAMKKMPIVSLFSTLVLLSSHPAEAQKPPTVRKIGFLASAGGPAEAHEVFRRSLRELGYAEGHNIVIEYRSA